MGLGRRSTEVKCPSQHIISRVCLINMTYHCWCWPWTPGWVFVSFSTIKLLWPPPTPSTFPLWKKITLGSLHFRGGKFCSTSLREEYLHKLSEILVQGNLSILHFYSIIYIIYLATHTVAVLAIWELFSGCLTPWHIPPLLCVSFLLLLGAPSLGLHT